MWKTNIDMDLMVIGSLGIKTRIVITVNIMMDQPLMDSYFVV